MSKITNDGLKGLANDAI